jgi:hypothetical protein
MPYTSHRPPVDTPARHESWCRCHGEAGCASRPARIPGTDIAVWLTASPSGQKTLIVDLPGGTIEINLP